MLNMELESRRKTSEKIHGFRGRGHRCDREGCGDRVRRKETSRCCYYGSSLKKEKKNTSCFCPFKFKLQFIRSQW